MSASRQDSLHHRHRLPRRRQDDADPPSARERRRAAPRHHRQRVRRSRLRRVAPRRLRHRGLHARTTSSSSPTAASAALSPTISCRRWKSSSTATAAGAHPHRDLGPRLAEAARHGLRLAGVRSRVTVDGVVAVVDAPPSPPAPSPTIRRRAGAARRRPSLAHDNPLEEVFEDQLLCADLILLNKIDLIATASTPASADEIAGHLPRAVKVVDTAHGRSTRASCSASTPRPRPTRRAPSHHEPRRGARPRRFRDLVVPVTTPCRARGSRRTRRGRRRDRRRAAHQGLCRGRRAAAAPRRPGRRPARRASLRPPLAGRRGARRPARRHRPQGLRPRRGRGRIAG